MRNLKSPTLSCDSLNEPHGFTDYLIQKKYVNEID